MPGWTEAGGADGLSVQNGSGVRGATLDNGRVEQRTRIEIEYCTQCRWLLRAAWMAQELLSTFEADLGEVALVPGTGGVFEVRIDGQTAWSREQRGRFPDVKELKQRVRDGIAPDRDLGHTDR